jgi:hypothetical protein
VHDCEIPRGLPESRYLRRYLLRHGPRSTVHAESSAHRHYCPCWRDHPSHKAANHSDCMGRYCTPPPRVKFRSEMNTCTVVEIVVNAPASRLISSFRGQMKQALHHYSKSTLFDEAITQLLLAIIGASALPCPAMPCLANFNERILLLLWARLQEALLGNPTVVCTNCEHRSSEHKRIRAACLKTGQLRPQSVTKMFGSRFELRKCTHESEGPIGHLFSNLSPALTCTVQGQSKFRGPRGSSLPFPSHDAKFLSCPAFLTRGAVWLLQTATRWTRVCAREREIESAQRHIILQRAFMPHGRGL